MKEKDILPTPTVLPEEKINALFDALLNLPHPPNIDFFEMEKYPNAVQTGKRTIFSAITNLTVQTLEIDLSNLQDILKRLANIVYNCPSVQEYNDQTKDLLVTPLFEELLAEIQITIDNNSKETDEINVNDIISTVRKSIWKQIGCHRY